jgi:uncharacterized protein YegL
MNDLTWIIVILDRSGSMTDIRDATEEGLNGFLKKQAAEPGDVKLTVVQFDTEYEVVYDLISIEDMEYIKLEPRGATALLDSVGKTLTQAKKRYDDAEPDSRPDKVFVVITTDGEENSSIEYNRNQINNLIDKARDVWNWQVIFTAANQDAIATAADLSIKHGNAITFAATKTGISELYKSLSHNMSAQRGMSSVDFLCAVQNSDYFSEEDRDAQSWSLDSTLCEHKIDEPYPIQEYAEVEIGTK